MNGPIEEDSMDSDIAGLLPPWPHERWFDLCFRLIIIALLGIWFLMPPAASEIRSGEIKAAAATR
jgi:hypothetical protein